MPRAFVALLTLTFALLATAPVAVGAQGFPSVAGTTSSSDWRTKVFQDSKGNVHVLWLVPALNTSLAGPGIWYSKYSPNGTDTIPPTRITNSTTVQSADLAVDNRNSAIIVWADENTSAPMVSSKLYLLHFNSTSPQRVQTLITRRSLILWPSLAPDNNGTIYMTWTEYNPNTARAIVEYGWISSSTFTQFEPIAAYNQVNAFPPQARVVFDNSSRHLQLAWGESQSNGQLGSTVNYAKLGSNGTLLTTLQVARFEETLRDVSITPLSGQDGAFVVWQTQNSNESVYVSQISARGQLVYLKQLNYTTGQSKYLAISTDSEDNLYVVWYQPSLNAQPTASTALPTTSVSYLRINVGGDIVQTENGVVRVPLIAATVLDGSLYGVSTNGLVKVVTPSNQNNPFEWIAAIVLASSVGVAGSAWIEEGRYKWLTLCSAVRIAFHSKKRNSTDEEVVRLLARKPGLNAGEINRSSDNDKIGMLRLIELEKGGSISSFRDGLSRRFYVKPTAGGSIDNLRTRIMLWVLEHPGIWEAQLAKDLGLSQQIVHYHLKRLRDAKMITTAIDSDGERKLYRFAGQASDKLQRPDI